MPLPSLIRLFIKPGCGWCHEVIDWLDAHSIRYQTLDVLSDRAAFAEMRSLSGQTRAPVIDVDGHVLADFDADELDQWWNHMGFTPSQT